MLAIVVCTFVTTGAQVVFSPCGVPQPPVLPMMVTQGTVGPQVMIPLVSDVSLPQYTQPAVLPSPMFPTNAVVYQQVFLWPLSVL